MGAERSLNGATELIGDEELEPLGSLLSPSRLSQWVWVLGYTAVLSSLSVLRYHLWLATGYDLGLFRQGMWLLTHKGILAVSTYTGHPILSDAASYVLLFLAPFYNLGGVGFLFVLQSFAFGLGYLFIRRIAERLGVNGDWSHLVGIVYLIYPTVLGANLFDFHPDALAVPLLFGLIWAALEERWFFYSILLILSIAVKDTVAVVVIGTGLALLLRRETLWGALTIVFGALSLYLNLFVVVPHLAGGTVMQWPAYYANLGATPGIGLQYLMAHPLRLVKWVEDIRSWEYLLWLIVPLSLIATFGWRRLLNPWWIPVATLLEVNLLSGTPALTSPFNEMSVALVPFLFVAVMTAIRGLPKPSRILANSIAGVAGVLLLAFGWHSYRLNWRYIPSNQMQLTAAIKLIPKNAPVVVPNFVAAHMADRTKEWLPSTAVGRVLPVGTYVLFDSAVTMRTTQPSTYALLRKGITAPGAAHVVYDKGGVIVYKLLLPVETGIHGS